MEKIAFICTHNSCRSQIAEAFGKALASDAFESWSAGTEIKDQINPDAVRIMKEREGIDMIKNGQHNKTLAELPSVDGVVTMGCGVECSFLPCKWRVDWGLDDPTGQADAAYLKTMEEIRPKVLDLRQQVLKERK